MSFVSTKEICTLFTVPYAAPGSCILISFTRVFAFYATDNHSQPGYKHRTNLIINSHEDRSDYQKMR